MKILPQNLHNHRLEIVPINSILDSVTHNGWRNKACTLEKIGGFYVFERIERILIAIAIDPTTNLDNEISSISFLFRGECQAVPPLVDLFEVKFTPEVSQWMINEKNYRQERIEAINLFDTFILLIILGAFGSIIFLLRDYLIEENKRAVVEYIFKPIFGMFLAIAVFISYIATKSIISKSDPLSINSKVLYLLGLGTGILSDRSYSFIVDNTKNILKNNLKSKQPP